MIIARILPVVAVALLAAPAFGADANGYTAQYECRSGGPNCNVDVAALVAQSCQQTVTTSTSWASIDWSNNVICIQAGDHISKGTLKITASGTAKTPKILKYYRASDTDDDPWNQSDANRAKIRRIELAGEYWIIQRITIPPYDGEMVGAITMGSGSTGAHNVIINRVLIEGMPSNPSGTYSGFFTNCEVSLDFSDITFQNSVIRNGYPKYNNAPLGAWPDCGTNIRLVNNEIYDWSEHPVQVGNNHGWTMPGFVVENNDLYYSGVFNLAGGKASTENVMDIKAEGTPDNLAKIIRNRIWGARPTDLSACCIGGSAGDGIAIVPPTGGGFRYILIKDNIIFNNQNGLLWANGTSDKQSVIGNIFWKMGQYDPNTASHAIWMAKTINTEIYLNTFIDNRQYGLSFGGGLENSDIRCNAFLSGGGRENMGTPDSGTQADANAFYDTTEWSANARYSNVVKAISDRKSSTAYSVGDIIRTAPADQCTKQTDSACFLYKVTSAGTTFGGAVSYCVSLGCTVTDGTAQLRAIRGPYVFYRKLRTSPEAMTVPYARAYFGAAPGDSAPDTGACPSDFAARTGVGINDDPVIGP
jgi:hypothetical protein